MGRWTKDAEPRYRKPDGNVLHIRQVPELAKEFRGWIVQHSDRWDYYGQRIGQEGLVNSLVAEFLAQPPEEQARRLAAGIVRAESLERDWNREMRRRVEQGEMSVDEQGRLHEVYAVPTPPTTARKSGSEPVRRPTPRSGRKRA